MHQATDLEQEALIVIGVNRNAMVEKAKEVIGEIGPSHLGVDENVIYHLFDGDRVFEIYDGLLNIDGAEEWPPSDEVAEKELSIWIQAADEQGRANLANVLREIREIGL